MDDAREQHAHYKAIKMYRNYDGQKSSFGDTSVAATVPNPDALSAFAARRSSDGALTVMVINKSLSGTTPAAVNLANFQTAGVAKVWQLTSANTITQLPDVALGRSHDHRDASAQSVTLFVVSAGVRPAPPEPAHERQNQGDVIRLESERARSGRFRPAPAHPKES